MTAFKKNPATGAQRKLGLIFLVTGVILNTAFRFVNVDKKMISDDFVIGISLLGGILIIIGAYLAYRGGQYKAKELASEIIDNAKPYVLYLRPFKSDVSMGKFMFTQFYFGNIITMEEQLAAVLKPFGDLLAIGKPGESLPKPGAAKIYASGEWEGVVAEKMKSAKLVIILAGEGEGLLWELREAFGRLNPEKLLILIPPMSIKSYNLFCVNATKNLNITLPDAGEIKQKIGFAVSQGFIRFSNNWQSGFLPLKSPFLRKEALTPYTSQFTFALKPVFENFGIEWHRPPYSKFLLIAGGLISLLLLFIVVILVLVYFHV